MMRTPSMNAAKHRGAALAAAALSLLPAAGCGSSDIPLADLETPADMPAPPAELPDLDDTPPEDRSPEAPVYE